MTIEGSVEKRVLVYPVDICVTEVIQFDPSIPDSTLPSDGDDNGSSKRRRRHSARNPLHALASTGGSPCAAVDVLFDDPVIDGAPMAMTGAY